MKDLNLAEAIELFGQAISSKSRKLLGNLKSALKLYICEDLGHNTRAMISTEFDKLCGSLNLQCFVEALMAVMADGERSLSALLKNSYDRQFDFFLLKE